MPADNTTKQIMDHNAKKNRMSILTMIFFVLAVLSSLLAYVMPIFPVVCLLVLFFGIITFVCAFNIQESSKTEDLHVMDNPVALDCKKLTKGLDTDADEKLYGIDGAICMENSTDTFTMSVPINEKFVTLPIPVEVSSSLYEFPEFVVPYTAYLKDSRNRELSKYASLRPDKVVVGIRSDITLERIAAGKPAIVSKMSRSAVQVTDDAFGKIIINRKKDDDNIVFNGRRLCIDDNGYLIPFSKSHSANEIDIHSLIISNDGYIMFRKGSVSHPLFAGEVISSASCSLLPSEIMPEKPLQESMIESIHNKIHVLYDIPADTRILSSTCGFARIIKRGGAPEIYVLTRIAMSKDELLAAHRDETAEFMPEMLKSMVPELKDAEDTADYIANAINVLRKAVGDEISLSASAMLAVILSAMYDEKIADKLLSRIGLSD